MKKELAPTGSYDPFAAPGRFNAELLRLQAQVELSWREEARLLAQAGLRDAMSVLEVGSGPGFVTAQLLALLPSARITALEISPEFTAIAREENSSPRVEFVEASILSSGLAERQFDFAIARLVFQHLADPMAAAREILRLLKPGGTLAILDVDAAFWGVVQPYVRELETIYRKARSLQAQQGGDPTIGRRMWRILKAAGFQSPRLEAFVYHSEELGLDAFDSQLSPERYLQAVQAGVISFEEYLAAARAYAEFRRSPDAYVLLAGLMAHGTKPLT